MTDNCHPHQGHEKLHEYDKGCCMCCNTTIASVHLKELENYKPSMPPEIYDKAKKEIESLEENKINDDGTISFCFSKTLSEWRLLRVANQLGKLHYST